MKLKHTFKSDGYTHTQIANKDGVYVYEKMKPDTKIVMYEVIIPQLGKYPDDYAWGSRGWTYMGKDDALLAMDVISRYESGELERPYENGEFTPLSELVRLAKQSSKTPTI